MFIKQMLKQQTFSSLVEQDEKGNIEALSEQGFINLKGFPLLHLFLKTYLYVFVAACLNTTLKIYDANRVKYQKEISCIICIHISQKSNLT